ncbi:MAG: DUF2442 domain-containing protein [Bacteroidota bacterium]|nr:DUF2442 domain-containing protein [Bacteroidota bacterium]
MAAKKKYSVQKNKITTVNEVAPAYNLKKVIGTGKPVIKSKDLLQYTNPGLNKILKDLSGKQVFSIPSPDYVDQFINKEDLKIDTLFIDKKHDHLFFVLNNGTTLQEKISRYPLLIDASEKKLKDYNLYAGGTCVEWDELNEDISLRGLLKDIVFDPLIKSLKNHKGFVLSAD